jgi:hypothetical protein
VQIGWKVPLPGRVWGDYARDKGTKDWALKHSKDVYNSKVIAFKRGVHGEVLFTVKFADETPFEISYAHLWPHLLPVHREAILHAGGTEPKACQSEPKKRGRRPSPIPPVLAERLRAQGEQPESGAAMAQGAAAVVAVTALEEQTEGKRARAADPGTVAGELRGRGTGGAGGSNPAGLPGGERQHMTSMPEATASMVHVTNGQHVNGLIAAMPMANHMGNAAAGVARGSESMAAFTMATSAGVRPGGAPGPRPGHLPKRDAYNGVPPKTTVRNSVRPNDKGGANGKAASAVVQSDSVLDANLAGDTNASAQHALYSNSAVQLSQRPTVVGVVVRPVHRQKHALREHADQPPTKRRRKPSHKTSVQQQAQHQKSVMPQAQQVAVAGNQQDLGQPAMRSQFKAKPQSQPSAQPQQRRRKPQDRPPKHMMKQHMAPSATRASGPAMPTASAAAVAAASKIAADAQQRTQPPARQQQQQQRRRRRQDHYPSADHYSTAVGPAIVPAVHFSIRVPAQATPGSKALVRVPGIGRAVVTIPPNARPLQEIRVSVPAQYDSQRRQHHGGPGHSAPYVQVSLCVSAACNLRKDQGSSAAPAAPLAN